MSLVKILCHNEDIYTILDKPPPDPPKTPRYQSKLEKQLKETKIPQMQRHFGKAEYPRKPKDQYMRKGEGYAQPIKKSDHKCFKRGNLPPVPKHKDRGKLPEMPTKNFKVENIKKAIHTRPKSPQPRLVDTRDGHIKRIKGSGEVPEYCLRPDFGQMPAYLVKRNRRIFEKRERIRIAEENRESLCKLVGQEERKKLLDELKHNWHLMQKAFLQLPMLTDTIPKIIKKNQMENELKQLEHDIALVESNPYIYIFE